VPTANTVPLALLIPVLGEAAVVAPAIVYVTFVTAQLSVATKIILLTV
jgi:hypothetical protein